MVISFWGSVSRLSSAESKDKQDRRRSPGLQETV